MFFKKLISSFFVFLSFSSIILAEVFLSHPTETSYNIIPINILSAGGIDASFAAKFACFVAMLLFMTVLIGKVLKIFFKLPTVAGQIIGGIILGQSFLNIRQFPLFAEPLKFIDATSKNIYTIISSDIFFFFILLISSALTVSYLLWIAGHETDIQDMAKVGIESTLGGTIGAIIPIIMIAAVLSYLFGNEISLASGVGIGIVFSATSVSIPIAMLIAQNKMGLRSSKATMGAAIVDDILAVILFSIFIVLLQNGFFVKQTSSLTLRNPIGIGTSLIKILLAFIIMFGVGKFFIVPTTRLFNKLKLEHLIPTFAAFIMLAYFSLAELLGGIAGITGAYFAGLFHRMGDENHKAEKAISPFLNTFLLPLFLGSIGMQVNLKLLSLGEWKIVFLILFLAILSKLIGCYLTTLICNILGKHKKWTFLQSYIFGSSMVARGEVGLVIATILNGTALITSTQYVICVAAIVLTTIASPIMLSIGFKKLDKLEKEKLKKKMYSTQIGPFEYVSSPQLFDTLVSILSKKEKTKPIIALPEGKKLLALINVKIMLIPPKGIFLEGNKEKILEIIKMLETGINKDLVQIDKTLHARIE